MLRHLSRLVALLLLAAVMSSSALAASKASLNDSRIGTSKTELVAQITHSQQVVSFFKQSDSKWMIASRHSSCTSVAWMHTCARARTIMRAHEWLLRTAKLRMLTLYPAPQVSHLGMWLCIHGKEGDWKTGYNPAGPYYGGLQMTWDWGSLSGDPRSYSMLEQIAAAESEWKNNHYSLTWLRHQWPHTSYGCI